MDKTQANTNQTPSCNDCDLLRIYEGLCNNADENFKELSESYDRLLRIFFEMNDKRTAAIDTLQRVQRWLQGLLQCVYRRQGEVLELPADSAYYFLDEVTEAIKDSK